MQRDEFVSYLRGTLIPDLRDSGQGFTADDLERACRFIESDDDTIDDSDLVGAIGD